TKLFYDKINSANRQNFEQYRELFSSINSKYTLLNEISMITGYGGLIHNFKNYLLRGNTQYSNQFNIQLQSSTFLIEKYRSINGITGEEHELLDIIEKTFNSYAKAINTIKELKREKYSINEIDNIVKIDDQPSINAFNKLRNINDHTLKDDWWDIASTRIATIKSVADTVSNSLITDTDKVILNERHNLLFYLSLIILILLFSVLVGIFLTRRLVNKLTIFSTTMNKMEHTGDFNKLLSVDGKDELADMAFAFNSLITERQRFEENLKLAAAVFENTGESIIVTDAKNNIEMVNPAFIKLSGFQKHELIGQPPSMWKSGNHSIQFYKTMWDKIFTTGYWEGEIWNLRKDGQVYPEWLAISLVKDTNGHVSHYIGMYTDITHKKQIERERESLQQQLMQAQKMEAIGHLTGGIAHDFNNILAGILGFADLAIELNDRYQDKKLDKYLNNIVSASKRARDMIKQMLEFSRNDFYNKSQNINIDSFLNDAANLLKPMLPASTHLVFEHEENLLMCADPVRLHQIIMNLVINARDAVQEKGTIKVTIRKISLHNETCSSCNKNIAGEFLSLSVTDNGSGIINDNISKLFKPFFTTKEIGKGSGMGLSIVHSIAHSYNGHVSVKSNPDSGSEFTVLLPQACVIIDCCQSMYPDDTKQLENKSINNLISRPLNIVVVDDEILISAFLVELLESKGHHVSEFNKSTEAINYIRSNINKIDLVITDQTMPGMTGTEMSEKLLAEYADLYIILLTGHSQYVDEKKALSTGISAFLTKPLDINKLLELIGKIPL
ncbi:MAG: response regulator, partial [Gammaproteobacteria bacterium]|nr:response regulator [Gammaproteobacteria bacterium]